MQKEDYIIGAERLLIISDIHQNLAWAKSIISSEKGNYDHILINGDLFDSHYEYPVVSTVKETAEFVVECIYGNYGPVTLHLGNHDTSYMEAWKYCAKYQTPRFVDGACRGYTNSKATNINKVMTWNDWMKFRLFSVFGGYIISHAGIAPGLWNLYKTNEENLDFLYKDTQEALELISVLPSKYLAAGIARGGNAVYGGLNWLDWDCEFTDKLPLPQIVGHSTKFNVLRKIGRSFCMDGMQSIYCILDKSTGPEFKTTAGKDNIPEFRDDTEFSNNAISKNFKY